jgi:hypothetical protein
METLPNVTTPSTKGDAKLVYYRPKANAYAFNHPAESLKLYGLAASALPADRVLKYREPLFSLKQALSLSYLRMWVPQYGISLTGPSAQTLKYSESDVAYPYAAPYAVSLVPYDASYGTVEDISGGLLERYTNGSMNKDTANMSLAH